MAERKGVAILREIALVTGSKVDDKVKAAMIAELNVELAKLYPVVGQQGSLDLAPASPPAARSSSKG